MNEKSSARFSHFVLTQFNLRNYSPERSISVEQWVEWTRKRIAFFKAYCLPSVLAQSNQNFKWLIFFDEDTPSEFSHFIDEIEKHDILEVCYSKGASGFYSTYYEEILKRITPEAEWVVTSRIDNDDCIHRDMVKVVQSGIRLKQGYMLSLASGYTLDVTTNRMSHYFYPMSPFISLVESAEGEVKGVFTKSHTAWDQLRLWVTKEMRTKWFKEDQRVTTFFLQEPMWIQTVHGGNVSNSFFRGLPVLKRKSLKNFGLDISSEPMSLLDIQKYFDYVTWKRYVKSTIVKLLS